MKKLTIFALLLLNIMMLVAQDITVEPQNVSADLIYGTTETQTVTITNNGTTAIDFSVEGVKTKVLAITNSVDQNVEYTRTLNALNVFYDNYILSEISTQEASELETALIDQNVLLVVQQENCNVPTFASFAPVMQAFVENGGTVIFTGTSRTNGIWDGQCIFATDLFSGDYTASITTNTDLPLSIPNDFLVEGVNDPYEEEIMTHYHDITNEDAVRVVEYEGGDVVVYRNIGQGKVISIGHSFLNVNNDLRRIIANAVKSGGGADWLNLSALEGTIPAGGTFTLDVTFDAGAVFGGLYELDLIIDDGTNETIFPVSLNVTGVASFAASPTSISFGEHLTGSVVSEIFTINNVGTDSLFITNIESDNPDFTVNITEAALYGGTSIEIEVTYAPLAIETDNAALSVYTNVSANPFVIPLTGEGIGAPTITPNPESIAVTLTEGEATTETVTITNTGLGTLDFTVEIGQGTGSGDVLIVADPNWDTNTYNNIFNIVSNTLPDDVIINQTYTFDVGEMQSLLQQHGILVFPFNDFDIANFFNNNPTLLPDFINNGGNILFINSLDISNGSGLFEGFFNFGFGGTFEIMEDHPITQNVPVTNPNIEFTNMIQFQNDVTSLINYDDGFATGSVVALNDSNEGLAVFISLDYFNLNNINEPVLANSIQFLFDNATPDWLSFSPDSFTDIGFPDGTADIDININSEGLLGGTYYAEIVLLNNSAIPEFIIPVTLVVIGVPQIVLETTDLDFGNVVIGNEPMQTITIDNPGTDTLFITNIAANGDGYTLSATSLTIPPLSSDELSITFIPTVAQDYGTTISLENNVENTVINVAAVGMEAPNASVSPANVTTTLLAGETSTESFTLNNTGAGILEYQTLAAAGTLEIAVWTYNISTFNYDNLQNALPNILTDYNLTEYSGTVPSELEDILQGKSILLIPSWNFGGNATNYQNMSETLQAFADGGGTIIVLGNPCLDCMNNSGLFESGDYAYVGGPFTIADTTHPLADDLQEPLNPTGFDWIIHDLQTGNDVIEANSFFLGGVLNYQNVGSGKIIYVGYNYASTGEDPLADQLLGNAFAWGGLLPDWLSISNNSGSIDPDGNFDIDLTFDATGLLAGTYTYDLVLLTNDPLNPTVTVSISMEVQAFPQAAFSGNTLICDGYGFFNDETLNDPTSWNWNFGDGNMSDQPNPVHFFENNGTYTVTLEACNDLGCDEATQTVEVNFAMMFCDTIALPATGNLTLNGCNGVLQDAGGDGQYPNNMNSFTTIAPQGASQITLTFTSFSYETNYDYIAVYEGYDIGGELLGFYEGDALPNGNGIVTFETGVITIEQHSDGSVIRDGFEATWECVAINDVPNTNFSSSVLDECTGLVGFTDISNNFPDTWTWDFGDDSEISNEQFPEHSYASSGTYTVTLEACNFIGCATFTQDITVENVLSVEFSLPDAQVGIPAQYINTTDNAASCTWNWGDGSPNSSGTCTPLHVYTAVGTYTITLEITDGDGCTRSASQEINVYPVGLNDVSANTSLKLYPNPASDIVQLNYAFEGQQQLEIQILDAVGRVVKSEKATALNGYQTQLNFGNQPKGYYIVSITSENGTVKKELLIQ